MVTGLLYMPPLEGGLLFPLSMISDVLPGICWRHLVFFELVMFSQDSYIYQPFSITFGSVSHVDLGIDTDNLDLFLPVQQTFQDMP